jgi:hypothetical protein
MNRHPAFNGMQTEFTHDAHGKLVAVTCRIHRKDRDHAVEVTEYLDECIRPTDPWKMPHRMLRHKAVIQCARYAFGFAGIYDEDEALNFAAETARDVTPAKAAPKPPAPPAAPVPVEQPQILAPPAPPAPTPPTAEMPRRKAPAPAGPRRPPAPTPVQDEPSMLDLIDVVTAPAPTDPVEDLANELGEVQSTEEFEAVWDRWEETVLAWPIGLRQRAQNIYDRNADRLIGQ